MRDLRPRKFSQLPQAPSACERWSRGLSLDTDLVLSWVVVVSRPCSRVVTAASRTQCPETCSEAMPKQVALPLLNDLCGPWQRAVPVCAPELGPSFLSGQLCALSHQPVLAFAAWVHPLLLPQELMVIVQGWGHTGGSVTTS